MDEQIKTVKQSPIIWILIMVLAMMATGSAVYFWQKNNAKNDELENKKLLGICEKQKLDLSASKPIANNQTTNSCPAKLPVIQFKPAIFTEQEKQELANKVLNPYIDYQKETPDNQLIALTITKFSEEELAKKTYAKYLYNIEAIFEEGSAGWLEREEGKPIDYWIPDCMGKCPFSESFKSQYPEVINKYNAVNL